MTSSSAHQAASHKPVPHKDDHKKAPKSEFASTALLLQGGGALGAYQAGVYQALAEAEVLPDWVGGISIGAINGAIIAGNKPAERVAKLRGFWEQVSALPPWAQSGMFEGMVEQGGVWAERFWSSISAGVSMTVGVPGFFVPRLISPFLAPDGTPAATSFYDTSALKGTLEHFIDFDVLNSGATRYSTSAVNVHSGNYVIFDTAKGKIRPEHVMASGALPPALPAVEVEGQYYWDGGLISNTPLQWVMDDPCRDTLVFQVDLWSSTGDFPANMAEVATRQKEIQYSSRTRAITSRFKHAQKMRHSFAELFKKMPRELRDTPEAKLLEHYADLNHYNIVHLIYHARNCEGYSKDFEFSRSTMEEHWKSGYNDTVRSLRHPEIFRKSETGAGMTTFDYSRE
jgi:NTE family protein